VLRVEAVETFYGASHVLQGVALDVAAGQVAAIVGRNGMGKTTTLRSIMGLAPPRRGRVTIEGTEITGWPPYRVARAGVAYVPEGRQIFPGLTARENIAVAQRRPPRRWPLGRLLELFPALAGRLEHRGRHLSGGEQQMLAIARALTTDPRVLLLDEPSQGLAPLVLRELARVIRRLADEGVTVLLVEQNLRFAEQVADWIFIMAKGRVVYGAALAEFREDEAALRARYLSL
jgi:branched-chain amino acid transport system ATP-binding protein